MNNKHIALKILLPVLVVSLVAFIVCMVKFQQIASGDEKEIAGTIFVTILVNLIPMISFLPLGAALLVVWVCLLAVKKKTGTVIAALVILCLLAPFLIFALVIEAFAAAKFSIILLAVILITAAAFFSSFVFCCIDISRYRKEKKAQKIYYTVPPMQ